MGRYLAPTKTISSANEVFNSFRRAVPEMGPAGLLVLTAHWAHETGEGQRCFNYNIAGQKGRIGGFSDWTFLTTHEGVRNAEGKLELVKFLAPPIHLQPSITSLAAAKALGPELYKRALTTCFLACASLDEATTRHIKLLSEGRHSPCWPFVLRGLPLEFGEALGISGYYTGPRPGYKAAMSKHFQKLMAEMPSWQAG